MKYKGYTISKCTPDVDTVSLKPYGKEQYTFGKGGIFGYGKSEQACKKLIDSIEQAGTYRTTQMKPK